MFCITPAITLLTSAHTFPSESTIFAKYFIRSVKNPVMASNPKDFGQKSSLKDRGTASRNSSTTFN
jgi:hypothetical protein